MMSISARRALTEARIVLAEQRIERLQAELAQCADPHFQFAAHTSPEEWATLTAHRLQSWTERLATLRAIHADLAGGW